jgi:aflatoxin B1 aldehyde reductase
VVREKLELSLKELNTNQVDIFYLHAADRSVPFAETLEVVNEMHKEGKFVQFGLSNYTAFEVAEIVITCTERGWVRPTIFQAMYNAISKLSWLIIFYCFHSGCFMSRTDRLNHSSQYRD